MAGPVTVTVEGTERFKAKLRNMRNSISGAESKDVGRKGAEIIKDKAQDNVHVITGHLRDSIRVEDSDEDGVAQVVAGGNGVDYAADEEYGNSRRPPHPYLRPAVDSEKSRVRTAMRSAVYSLIKRAAR